MPNIFKNYFIKTSIIIFFVFILSTGKAGALSIMNEPDPLYLDNTGNFQLSLNVDDTTHIRGYHIIFAYDDSVINFDSAEKGNLLAEQNIGWWVVDELSTDSVKVECIIFGAGLYVQGPGEILKINFTNSVEGRSYFNFIEWQIYDTAGEVIAGTEADDGNILIGSPSYVSFELLLEGPYNTSSDTMQAISSSEIPLNSPYQANYEIDSIPENVVDWILVELRETASGPSIGQKSMFLNQKGKAVDPFFSYPGFLAVDPGSYFMVIRHRNHLPIMSQNACQFVESGFCYNVDLSQESNIYGSNAFKELKTGIFGMAASDMNPDGEITTADYTIWYNSFFQGDYGYEAADINFDGEITTTDYINWYNNYILGISSAVPEQ